MKKKIIILSIIAIVIIATGLFFYLRGNGKNTAYKTEKVSRGEIKSVVTATGTVNAVTTVSVGTQVSGTIKRLMVDYNSPVKKGQLLAQIDPSTVQAQVDQANANLWSAKATMEKAAVATLDARRTLQRNKELFAQNFIARSDLDTAETNSQSAEAQQKVTQAQVGQAQAALKIAETNLQYTNILSPVDGTVISRSVDVGQTVAASFQTPTLFSIAQDLTKMQIDTNVDEADIGKVQVGQEVSFTVDAYPDTIFNGKVAVVRNAPITVSNVVTYDVVIQVDNPQLKLKPGMTANVSITIETRKDVLRISNAALRFKPAEVKGKSEKTQDKQGMKGTKVWILENDKPKPVKVTIGLSDGNYTEISAGELKEGQEIITDNLNNKKDSSSSASAEVHALMTLIETHKLAKLYDVGDEGIHALEDVSVKIEKGEFVAIMGPSGSGKSTFMNIVGCLDQPTAGEYLLDGQKISGLSRDELATIRNQKIGFVFQGFNLLSRTSALENVELPLLYNHVPPKERKNKSLAALKMLGLEGREHHHPNQLSGGQQQRVAIARALVNDAPILMADEPTGNLDTKTSIEIMELLVQLNSNSGTTIILVTHESDIAAFSKRIIRFVDGHVISDEEVKKS